MTSVWQRFLTTTVTSHVLRKVRVVSGVLEAAGVSLLDRTHLDVHLLCQLRAVRRAGRVSQGEVQWNLMPSIPPHTTAGARGQSPM